MIPKTASENHAFGFSFGRFPVCTHSDAFALTVPDLPCNKIISASAGIFRPPHKKRPMGFVVCKTKIFAVNSSGSGGHSAYRTPAVPCLCGTAERVRSRKSRKRRPRARIFFCLVCPMTHLTCRFCAHDKKRYLRGLKKRYLAIDNRR